MVHNKGQSHKLCFHAFTIFVKFGKLQRPNGTILKTEVA